MRVTLSSSTAKEARLISSFLDTREVAEYLSINEKQVYSLIHNRGLPGTKITGKWLFPRHLVDRWIESGVADFSGEWSFAQREIGRAHV